MAAHEAHQGHGALAHDIREIIDKARRTRGSNTLLKFPQDLAGLVLSQNSDLPLSALVVPEAFKERILRVIHEFRQQAKLKKYGMSNRRKLLLAGPPGIGKTMTARILSHELRLPLHTIQVDKLVTKFMGGSLADRGGPQCRLHPLRHMIWHRSRTRPIRPRRRSPSRRLVA